MIRPRTRTLIVAVLFVAAILLILALFGAPRDNAALGSRAYDLAAGPFVTVTAEIDSQVSLGPDVGRFTDFLQRYTGKLVTSQVGPLDASPADCPVGSAITGCTYSDVQVLDIERASRNSHSGIVGWLAIHVVVLNGRSSDDQPPYRVAGFTIDATAFVVFWPSIPSGFVPAVMAHESGHLMGLMCLNYPVSDDSKCDGNGHSSDSQSLMAPVLNPSSPWVRDLQLQPNETYDLGHYVTNSPAPSVGLDYFYVR